METWMIFAIGFVLGCLFGAVVVFLVNRQSESQRREYSTNLLDTMKGSFSTISTDVLDKSQSNFLKLADQRFETQTTKHTTELDNKKGLIDQRLGQLTSSLDQVRNLIGEFEKERGEKLGALGGELSSLTKTAKELHNVLSNNQTRGQWGERIAEDILNTLGLIKGKNYETQSTNTAGIRPDFTFFLPNDLTLNMDSKFPMTNYEKYINAEAKADKEQSLKDFLKDVRGHVKAISKKEYINVNTVDVALIFIPNEHMYRFIHEQDGTIIDDALTQKIILCSPLSLYTVLAVIRQAVRNFALEQSSHEILNVLEEFQNEWGNFIKSMDMMGKSLHKTSETYEHLLGVRKRKLETQLKKVEDLQTL